MIRAQTGGLLKMDFQGMGARFVGHFTCAASFRKYSRSSSLINRLLFGESEIKITKKMPQTIANEPKK